MSFTVKSNTDGGGMEAIGDSLGLQKSCAKFDGSVMSMTHLHLLNDVVSCRFIEGSDPVAKIQSGMQKKPHGPR